ncbi:hypothetical protein NDU88_000330, partial [Pleurodeles waltl]
YMMHCLTALEGVLLLLMGLHLSLDRRTGGLQVNDALSNGLGRRVASVNGATLDRRTGGL